MAGLERFLRAQEGTYETALRELREGAKRSHWMWWVFPQAEGLGRSPTARAYGLRGLEEARDYLAHPVLGPRLVAACEAMLVSEGRRAEEVLGPVDAMKLRSCATLFAALPGAPGVFGRILDAFHGGEPDPLTLSLIGEG